MELDYEQSYIQHLLPELKQLYFNDERYIDLRNFIASKCNDEVVFAVRKNEIHIYYLGGRILKITKAYNYLKLTIDLKYAKKQKGSDELNQYGDTIKKLNSTSYKDPKKVTKLWKKHWEDLKRCMEIYRKNVSHNDERQLQQKLELANRDFSNEVVVIDNEYGVRKEHKRSSKLCKVDLVTLYRNGEKYKICLIELKFKDGAIDKKAGISDHIADFDVIVNARKRDVIESVNNLIEYKKLNGSLYNVPNDLKLSEDTEICASILCYNLEDKEKASREISNGNKKGITFDLHFNLRLSDKRLKLTKEDILGQ